MADGKKILCMIDTLGAGGAQRQLVELALGYQSRGYDVAFLVYYLAFSDYYIPVLKEAGIPVYDVNEPNYLLRIFKMRRQMLRFSPDVVLAFLEVPAFIAEMASLFPHKWRLIVGERSAAPKKLTDRRLRFFLHCHRFADAVVANSEANLRILRQVAPEVSNSKQHVIYNGFDISRFSLDSSFRFCSQPRRNLLIASSHRWLKNLDGLIEAVRLLPEDLRNRLEVNWYGHNKFNGTDTSFDDGQKKIFDYGLSEIFSFHPDTLDIYQHMRKADAVGLFSRFEGFPNAICEGMLLGKPILATRVSDIPILLREDENAFLCDAGSPETIAAALTAFLTAPTETLQAMGWRNAEDARHLFDKETILNQYAELF